MTRHAVVIVGGGPSGLTLAGELALAKVDVAIVERRADQELAGSRAGGLHSRTIELLDQRGIAERFLSRGTKAPITSFVVPLDIGDFPTRHNYGLALWQSHIERILAGWVEELGVPIYRGVEAIGCSQHDTGVVVELSDGHGRIEAQYLVGCDGGRSLVRKAAGIDFPGWDPSTSYMIAEVEMTETPAWGVRRDAVGTYALGKHENGTRVRVVLRDEQVVPRGEPTLEELRRALVALYGTDYGLRGATWLSRFTDATRLATRYREGRVLLAGDAAHVHSPVGGQGLNLGMHDAMNLGWKLAQVIQDVAPDRILDTYHAERHPIGARVLRSTMAITALGRGDARNDALRDCMSELLAMDEPRKRYAALMSGLDVHYELGEGHPLLGRRMPDLDVATPGGPRRVFELLHAARPILLELDEPIGHVVTPWADRVRRIEARYTGAWEIPVFGEVSAPRAVLVRPDGYVAWVGEGGHAGLAEALTLWFGAPGSA